MPTKLKPTSIGLTLGILLVILTTLKTIIIYLFPDLIVKYSNKITYGMISIRPPVITSDAFVIVIAAVFFGGLVLGIAFSWVYNWVVR